MTPDLKGLLPNPTDGGSYLRNPDGSLVCLDGPLLEITAKPDPQPDEAVQIAQPAGQKPARAVKDV